LETRLLSTTKKLKQGSIPKRPKFGQIGACLRV
jgi:hypothetical protein